MSQSYIPVGDIYRFYSALLRICRAYHGHEGRSRVTLKWSVRAEAALSPLLIEARRGVWAITIEKETAELMAGE